jgi:Protein of unknown function (Hypoth_ymh)
MQLPLGRGFQGELLHPAIAQVSYMAVLRGEWRPAITEALTTLEKAVRLAGKYPDKLVGVKLMEAAFNVENGPLTDMNRPEGERAGMRNVFSGAFGAHRNVHSHGFHS